MSAKAKQAASASGCPTCLHKLKAPRVLERLEQTAERARAEQWPYEQFLEALLEAEVFARDASGARQRIRHAQFPARKTLEDFDWAAQPAAERPLVMHLAQLAWIEEHANVCFFGPPGTGKVAPRDRARDEGLRAGLPRRASRPPRNGSRGSRPPRTATGSRPSCAGSSATTCWSSTRSAVRHEAPYEPGGERGPPAGRRDGRLKLGAARRLR